MEFVEARALKSSFLSQLAMKSTQQGFFDDFMDGNGINGCSYDDFPVDVFLDLSNDDLEDKFLGGDEEAEELERGTKSSSSVSSVEDDVYNSAAGDSASLAAGELPVPIDDLESLEWLSQFADDSVPELSFPCLAGDFKEKPGFSLPSRSEPVSRPVVQRTPVLCFSSPVPAKARSKRSRPGGQAWLRGSPSVSESSSATVSSCMSSPTSVFSLWNPVHSMELFDGAVKPPAKKQRKRPAVKTTAEDVSGTQSLRRCSHCQVQKTPQWRAGPLGPKTLCNACGVRYKSGRLFPEYRPACSPTFSGEVHSNSHRKVLEMRRKKEGTGGEPGMTAMIRGY